jgi:uncharacterized caspase-like protein
MKTKTYPTLPYHCALVALLLVGSGLQAQDRRGAGVRPVAPDQKVALVIGNADYSKEIGKLKNPTNDAADVAAVLKRLGFNLVGGKAHLNLNKRQMLELIRDFGGQLQGGGMGLFYFAGHGVQVDKHNYLIPITDLLQYQEDAEYEAVDADTVLREMEYAGNFVNILILDACRNNNLPKKRRTTANGLTEPARKPEGTLIAFSTADGQTASDNPEGRNGLFTQELLKYIEMPDLPIDRMFRTVRNEVKRLSKNSQLPFLYQSLSEDVFLSTTESVAAQPSPQPRPSPTPAVSNPPSITVSNTPASQPNVNDADALARQALTELMKGNDPSANKMATNALKLNKNLPLALAVSGYTKLYIDKKEKEGRSELERAVQLESQNILYLALLARFNAIDFREKTWSADKETAKRIANQVLTLNPKTDVEYYARGISRKVIAENTYWKSSKEEHKIWADAAADFTKAIELNPQFLIAYDGRGWAYYRVKEYDKAIMDFSKVIEMKPNGTSGYAGRSLAYKERREDYDNAIKDFNKVLELETNTAARAFIFNHRGNVYFNKGEYDKAIADQTTAIQLYKYGLFYSDRAKAYKKIGRNDLAEADEKRASKY